MLAFGLNDCARLAFTRMCIVDYVQNAHVFVIGVEMLDDGDWSLHVLVRGEAMTQFVASK